MYWVVDAVCYFAGIALLVRALSLGEGLIGMGALLWIWIYPLMLEYTYNKVALYSTLKISYVGNKTCRFVYHPAYSISLWGLEKLHPFDTQKYASIYQKLLFKKIIKPENIIIPSKPSRRFLLQRMSKLYLTKLCYSLQICKCVELPCWFLPSWFLRWRVLDPMLLATQGSILASCLALDMGWAVNLSGGFHHASWDKGEGFCIYPDISLTVHYLKTRRAIKKIMIIDLDAHQGNGYEKDLVIEEDVYIVDCYNHRIYPGDQEAKEAIGRIIPITKSTSNQQYLSLLDQIKQDFNCFQPQFVIYNAGTDILANDPLGKLQISPETIIERDSRIIGMCVQKGVPIVMFLSGGYQSTNAEVIADSLQNVLRMFP